MRSVFLMLSLCTPLAATAQTFSGPAVAVDGDTLRIGDERVRLFGIDAPEGMQTCERGGARWACGADATALLAQRIAGRSVECQARDRDHYDRIVAICAAGGSDLAAAMVREGLAVALPRFTDAYVEAEARAKGFKLALWGSTFQLPADFRAANAALFAPPAPRARVQRASYSPPRTAGYTGGAFRNCAAARAAGRTPLYRGQPGYGSHMDGDGDGVACERG